MTDIERPAELPVEEVPPDTVDVEAQLGWDVHPTTALFLVVIATALGAVVRVAPFGGQAFPLNDGGLPYEMVRAVLAHGFAIPFDVNYNGLELPFASPPVGLYVVAATSGGLGIPIPQAQALVAVAASILTIPMLYVVARQLLSSRQLAVGASFAFALTPFAYEWLITGSGAARGIGLLLVLLSIHQFLLAMKRGSWVNAVNAGALTGLTWLTVPRGAFLLLITLILLGIFQAKPVRLARMVVIVAVVAAATASVWLEVTISRHGIQSVTAAIIAGSDPATSLKTLLSFNLSGAPILDIMSILGVVGAVALLLERRFLLPIWFVLLFVVDQRTGITYAMVPFAMMVSHAATEIVVRWPAAIHLRGWHVRLDRYAAVALSTAVLLATLVGALTASVPPDSPMHRVSPNGLSAMIWARDNLNPGSRVVVLTPDRWEVDAYGTWLPAIAGVQSVATVQGYEWLGLDKLALQVQRHAAVQDCVAHTIDCLESWIHDQGIIVDYVLIPKPTPPRADCCAAPRESLRDSKDFQVVYDGPGATIAAVVGGSAQTDPVLVGAGDIAACDSPGAASTAALVAGIPGTVFTLGDNAYEVGSPDDFANCFDPTWGRFRDRTRPTPGNHDYYTDGAGPYFDYFGGSAGNPNEGWYSYDFGSWHVIVLNSDCDSVGGCGPGSRQVTWLANDLSTDHAQCTLAMWHHALFTSGSELPTQATADFWRLLYSAGADLILNGHDHDYERFEPMAPDGTLDSARGIRELVVGTGGRNLLPWRTAPAPGTVVRDNSTFGVMKLTLHTDSYDWQFIPVTDGAFSDSGTGTCH
jgi:hypothetical protein